MVLEVSNVLNDYCVDFGEDLSGYGDQNRGSLFDYCLRVA